MLNRERKRADEAEERLNQMRQLYEKRLDEVYAELREERQQNQAELRAERQQRQAELQEERQQNQTVQQEMLARIAENQSILIRMLQQRQNGGGNDHPSATG